MSMRRTIIRFAERTDIHPALKKVWKKHFEVNGVVTQHLSPFEQNIISPMFYNAHAKIFKQLSEMIFEMGPGLAFGVGVYFYGNWKHKDLAFHHRD